MYFTYLIRKWTDEGHECEKCGKKLFLTDTVFTNTEQRNVVSLIACTEKCIQGLIDDNALIRVENAGNFEIFQHASGEFLTEQVPEAWQQWGVDERLAWIDGKINWVYQWYEPENIYPMIQESAESWTRFISQLGGEKFPPCPGVGTSATPPSAGTPRNAP